MFDTDLIFSLPSTCEFCLYLTVIYPYFVDIERGAAKHPSIPALRSMRLKDRGIERTMGHLDYEQIKG